MTEPLKVLVACEFSGTVRNAFNALGHNAWSVDLLPAEDGSNRHIVGDATDYLDEGWDILMVAHPPCTRLCLSGLRWLHEPPKGKTQAEMWADLEAGATLFSKFWNAPIERICVENPKMHRHAKQRIVNYQEPTQFVQPWWFGEPVFKATGLYLKGLAPLTPVNPLTPPVQTSAEGRAWSKIHRASGWNPDRWRERVRFFPGVAAAMAAQWGGEVTESAVGAVA